MTSDAEAEAARVRAAYARRESLGLDARYDYWQSANLFIYQSRERAVLAALSRAGLLPLDTRSVLDVGCGSGAVLHDMQRYGAHAADLHGIDLLPERVERARELLPGARIEAGDAQSLPYDAASCDLVLGFTLLSSVLDDGVRGRIAAEMRRVARPGGVVLLYDFWTNPLNRDARPLRRADVRRFFPGQRIEFQSVTLAPPLTRLLIKAPGGWLACTALEVLPFLKTHLLATVRC